jgi:hypothetical protein
MILGKHVPIQFRESLLHEIMHGIIEIGRARDGIEAKHAAAQNIGSELGQLLGIKLQRARAAKEKYGQLIGIAAKIGQGHLVIAVLQPQTAMNFIK